MKASFKDSKKLDQVRSPATAVAFVNPHARVIGKNPPPMVPSHTATPCFLSTTASQLTSNPNDSSELTMEETKSDSDLKNLSSLLARPETPPVTNISRVFGIAASAKDEREKALSKLKSLETKYNELKD